MIKRFLRKWLFPDLVAYCGLCKKEITDHGTYLRCEDEGCPNKGAILPTTIGLVRAQERKELILK